MKLHFYILLSLLFVFAFVFALSEEPSKHADSLTTEHWETFPIGDINGDGKPDTAFVFTPSLLVGDNGCKDDSCYNIVKFSCGLPDLYHPNSIYGRVENLGHLSCGKVSDLLFVPDWFQSCWSAIYVYQFKDGKWFQIANAGVYKCFDTPKKRIVKKNKSWFLNGQTWDLKTENIKDYKVKIKWR